MSHSFEYIAVKSVKSTSSRPDRPNRATESSKRVSIPVEVRNVLPKQGKKEICLCFLSAQGCKGKNGNCLIKNLCHFKPTTLPDSVREFIEKNYAIQENRLGSTPSAKCNFQRVTDEVNRVLIRHGLSPPKAVPISVIQNGNPNYLTEDQQRVVPVDKYLNSSVYYEEKLALIPGLTKLLKFLLEKYPGTMINIDHDGTLFYTMIPFGTIEKREVDLAVDARVIHDLSFPVGKSVNGNTKPDVGADVSYDGADALSNRALDVA
ncbi:hypothetical protein PHMEG_0003578 [Phytophthora megakarya]|uniref:Uncharacterized protein n=1 Tax=Phytophthora megakarya TaxID=4795 RepID=A0A225WW22_9STRA|nr:hypothetical protein PHMEG_0003578 [Phytophthora megakarya]